MKVLLVNTSERIGGAAVACGRLLEALNKQGVEAKMLVRDKQTNHPQVTAVGHKWWMKGCFVWERFCIWVANRLSRKNLFAVDIANAGIDITRLPIFKEADIIHLHWVNQGMLSLKGIRKILASGKPVVWTMHDMWPCTGICHHARECTFYKSSCHHCPYLTTNNKHDLSEKIFKKKNKNFQVGKISFVACSRWLEELAKESALGKGHNITNIPNPIDSNLFKPIDKVEARKRCGLPENRKLILFGAVKTTDKRKGIDYLIESCQLLCAKYPVLKEKVGVIIVGGQSQELEKLIPFNTYSMGYVSDGKRMVDIYNAADLFATPSLEENLPNTIMEAMACGTPCVGFRIGGIPEMIDHQKNGYVATYRSAEDFAKGIHWVLDECDYQKLQVEARQKVLNCYSEESVAQRYIEIYNEAKK